MTDEYPDTNKNGIPDAFENRQPISAILNQPARPTAARADNINTWSSKNFSEPIRIELIEGRDSFTVVENTPSRIVIIVEPAQ